jgi:actin-like ATPase involved in cell morphogenesis
VQDSEKLVYDKLAEVHRALPQYKWVEVGGKVSREEIVSGAATIMRQLIAAGTAQGASSERVLLGLPITFSGRARKRMIESLCETELLGGYHDLLRRVRFVREPIAAAAAAVYEGYDFADRETVLVFDHGGGTLDLCLIEFQRVAGFDVPMPVRELGAGGRGDVAGSAMDQALMKELRLDPEIDRALEPLDEYTLQEQIKAAKQTLSTRPSYEVITESGDVQVTQHILTRALRPLLASIVQELDRTCDVAGLAPQDVDRVLMTGGSSLMPAVQDTLAAYFSHLDEYRLRRYDPSDEGDIERAITEVAQGLVHVARDDTIEQIVHWDLTLSTSEHPEFVTVAPRGTPYARGDDGEPELLVYHDIDDTNRDGMSFGIYEHQLDQEFVFGLAEVPRQDQPARLEMRFRPNEVFPRLRLLNADGTPIRRGKRAGPRCDIFAEADLMALDEGYLEEFFAIDLEYLPDVHFTRFTHAPLSRLLKEDDLVEVTIPSGNGQLTRCRGAIARVVRRNDGADIKEMNSWNLRDFEFDITVMVFQSPTGRRMTSKHGRTFRVRADHGYIRLAPKQQ